MSCHESRELCAKVEEKKLLVKACALSLKPSQAAPINPKPASKLNRSECGNVFFKRRGMASKQVGPSQSTTSVCFPLKSASRKGKNSGGLATANKSMPPMQKRSRAKPLCALAKDLLKTIADLRVGCRVGSQLRASLVHTSIWRCLFWRVPLLSGLAGLAPPPPPHLR